MRHLRAPKGVNRTKVVAYYRAGHTLRQCASHFGVSMQRCHIIVRTDAPEIMRPPYDKHFLWRRRA